MAVPDRTAVVDASVAVKLVIDEPLSDRATRLYDDSVSSDRPLNAPSILRNEVTNAVYRRYRRNDLTEASADLAVSRFAAFRFAVLAPSNLVVEAYAFAKRHRLGAIYDSLYVVLARDLGADLWTDDQKLLNAVAGTAPWVRWIGHYPDGG